MPVIKRYPNRKLYDTEAKKYITLNGIAELIRGGEDVQVIDHTTGDDLTTITLTQIIFEQEKKDGDFLPRSLLTGLIQSGGEKLSTIRRTLASPLDLLRHVDEEIDHRVRALINRGELEEEEGLSLLEKLISQGRKDAEAHPFISEERLQEALAERGVPNREDVAELETQLELLSKKLDEMMDTHS